MKPKIHTALTAGVFFFISFTFGQNIKVSLKLFLEGPYNGSGLNTSLNANNSLPLQQPYNVAPWNYPGTEQVTAIPNANVVDWVLVELRETSGNASMAYSEDSIATRAGFLLSNGSIVSPDGSSPLLFNCIVTYKIYAVVYQRNHLSVLSAGNLIYNGVTYSWNFSTGAGQAYGGGVAHKELSPGVWGLASGDGNADGQVNHGDVHDVWLLQGGWSGYHGGDFNMDGQVNNADKVEWWATNAGMGSYVVGNWTCGHPFEDERDGKIYPTVQAGIHCWMAANLNTGIMVPGSAGMTDNGVTEKYCYGDVAANCDVYGGLYQWDEMMQYNATAGAEGICPPTGGWHIPLDAEWCLLEQAADSTVVCENSGWRGVDCGGKLKEAGTVHWAPPNTGGNNASGFTALPGGYRYYDNGIFYSLHLNCFFWSSSSSGNHAWYRYLTYDYTQVLREKEHPEYGFSVRCVKSLSNQPPLQPSDPSPEHGATCQSLLQQLSWTCTDPENDPLTYDVYFGAANPPEKVSSGLADTTYLPDTLQYGTGYYWKIIARDDHDNISEGPLWSFATLTEPAWVCGDSITDPRDDRAYTTLRIGDLCWMEQNLDAGLMIGGSEEMTDNDTLEKYCYGDDPANCLTYGGLYQWDELMAYDSVGAAGICPPLAGWHVPTDEEWCGLEQSLDSTITCTSTGWRGMDGGGKLKETGTAHWSPPNTGATNTSGFTALPGGHRSLSGGSFAGMTAYSLFWSSSGNGPVAAGRALSYLSARSGRNDHDKHLGLSLRCVRQASSLPPDVPYNPNPPDSATHVPANTQLSWSCSDPENDPLSFDVYFGTATSPFKVTKGVTATSFDPGVLENNKSYVWKIVAYDGQGNTVKSPVWTFSTSILSVWKCGDSLVDPRDGRVYPTMQLDDQCWMAENLDIGILIPGTANPSDNGIIEKYCYNDSTEHCEAYGGLYQWNELMNYTNVPGAKGICPPAGPWHVPTDEEWCELEQFLDSTITCNTTGWRGMDGGGKLKETGTAHWSPPNTGATNESGLAALPGGYRYSANNTFFNLRGTGYYWSSTSVDTGAWRRSLNYRSTQVFRAYSTKTDSFSVRCVK